MTSKQAFLQNVTALLTSTTEKGDFTCIKQFLGCFSVTPVTMDISELKTQIENIDVQAARAILSKLLLTLQNDSHE